MFLDIFVLLLFVISGVIAFLRGFVREALAIVGLALAFAGGYFLGPLLQPLFEGWLGVDPAAEETAKFFGILPKDLAAAALARGSVFIVVLLLFSLATHLLAEFIKSIGLGAVDRSLGVVFGLLRAVLVAAVLYMPVHFLVADDTKEDWFASSKTHFYVEKSTEFIIAAIPSNLIPKGDDKTSDEDGNIIEKTTSSARAKLQAMDLLRTDLSADERAQLVREKYDSGELKEIIDGTGYSEEFRGQLDALFEQSSEGSFNE